MLTIKVIHPDNSEWIEEVTSLSVNTPAQSFTKRWSIEYFRLSRKSGDEHLLQSIWEGHVYLMNELGKTIGSWELGCDPSKEETKQGVD